MDIKIVHATIDNVEKANDFLTRLIQDEKKYDKNINQDCKVLSCYENLIENENNCVLFAVLNDVIVGYLYGYIVDNGDAYLEKVSKLEAMYVEKAYRQQGIGNLLIQHFTTIWAKEKKVKYVELNVCSLNEEAIHLYQKNGFVVTKYVMQLELEV